MHTIKTALYILLTFFCPLWAAATGFVLNGNVEGLQSGVLSLAYTNDAGEDTMLTANITNGRFTLAGKVSEPQLVNFTITQGWSYNTRFFLENAPITFQLVKDAPEKTIITGSANEVIYEKLKPGLNTFFANARQNDGAHQQANSTFNAAALKSADSVWTAQQHQWIQNIRTAIAATADNYAAMYFIRWLLYRPDNYDTILAAYMQLSPAVRNGAAGKKLLSDFEHMRRTAPGQPAPEVTGKDTLGQSPRLAQFKGKVVLLDFWSSYCGPCRQENRRMVPVYQKYQPKGFEIVSFSMDNDRNQWLQALRTDAMPWAQVSELRGGASTTSGIYEVTDLPRNVLIDRTGKIYAKDLHGEQLNVAIETLLGKK